MNRLPAGCTTADIDAAFGGADPIEHWCQWCGRETFGYFEAGNGFVCDQFVCDECKRGTDIADQGDDEEIARTPIQVDCPPQCTCHGKAAS